MKTFDATTAKNRFGELLAACAGKPVAIERHGRVVAYVVSPAHFDEAPAALPDRLATRLGALGARYAMLFGSIAKGVERPDSDVDIAVSFGKPMSSDLRAAVIGVIGDAAGRPVDLVDLETERSLLFTRAMAGIELVCDSLATRQHMLRRLLVAEDEARNARVAARATRAGLFA